MRPVAMGASFSLSEEDEVESESDAAAKNLDMLIGVGGHSAISEWVWGSNQGLKWRWGSLHYSCDTYFRK